MVLKNDEQCVEFCCDDCGSVFTAEKKEAAKERERWVSEGWRVKADKTHLCPDCAIDVMPLRSVQNELRYPRSGSSAWRRQHLWKRLDKLYARPDH